MINDPIYSLIKSVFGNINYDWLLIATLAACFSWGLDMLLVSRSRPFWESYQNDPLRITWHFFILAPLVAAYIVIGDIGSSIWGGLSGIGYNTQIYLSPFFRLLSFSH